MTNLLAPLLSHPDDADAVRVGADSISRHDLLARAEQVAGTVERSGPVAVVAEPTLDTVVTIVGCLLAHIPVVPVPPDSGPGEREHILRDSAATAPRDDTALILYTSGTTGAPKGVELSHAAIAAGLDGLADAWQWTADDTLVHGLPLFHTHGLILGVLGALRVGSRLRHTGRPTPEAYAATPGSMYFGVPTVWGRIATDPTAAAALAPARLLVSGSAALPLTTYERLAGLTGHRPVERYGMTETMITLSTRPDGERRPGWVGLPVGGAETRISEPDDEGIGALEVRGPMLFSGYLGLPGKTAESWTDDGWFVTGDVATTDADGMHRIVGRASTDLIKSGGYRIGAGEIENALLDHPAVAEAAVVGRPDDDLGERIVAYVVADAIDAQTLVDHVAERLSWHKRPREVVFVDALPRNAMGKVQKTRLD